MRDQQLLYRATQLHKVGQIAEAERLYTEVLTRTPSNFAALHMFGLLRLQQGRYQDALALIEAALTQQPESVETMSNHGLVLRALGRADEALTRFDRAVQLRVDYAAGWNNRGCLLMEEMGRLEAALASFERAVEANPDFPEAWNNRGLAQMGLDRCDEAVSSFDRVLAFDPRNIEALNNRSVTLRSLKRHAEALANSNQALAINQHFADAWNNRGSILWDMDLIDEALASFDRALLLQPNFAQALHNRAELFRAGRKLLAPAIADLESLVRVAPEFPYARGNLLHLKMHVADWRDFDSAKSILDQGVRAGHRVAEPFVYQGLSNSPADMLACSKYYAADAFPALPSLRSGQRRPGKIRIGYVCSEFRQQATAHLAAGLFDRHDKSRFDIVAFDNGINDHSAMRARLEAAFGKFVPIRGLPGEAATRAVASEGIDILVNLNGYFGGMRMDVFARQPAPIQVNYLGFPGTLGADYIDYIVADACVIPPSERHFYTEKVAYLPHAYQPNDDKRPIGPSTTRAEHGLPEHAFVFCHFNVSYKLTPDMFTIWLRLLKHVQGSVLWLLGTEDLFQDNLRRTAEQHGVDASRIIFAQYLPVDLHLARLALGDLFLDSLPCNAHTTASDALWAGLPILTCRGGTFSGRVAASLLHALNLSELVTSDLQDYESLALRLAHEPELLAGLRKKLSANRSISPLFDTARYTHHLEEAFETMFRTWQQGRRPQSFTVAP